MIRKTRKKENGKGKAKRKSVKGRERERERKREREGGQEEWRAREVIIMHTSFQIVEIETVLLF